MRMIIFVGPWHLKVWKPLHYTIKKKMKKCWMLNWKHTGIHPLCHVYVLFFSSSIISYSSLIDTYWPQTPCWTIINLEMTAPYYMTVWLFMVWLNMCVEVWISLRRGYEVQSVEGFVWVQTKHTFWNTIKTHQP